MPLGLSGRSHHRRAALRIGLDVPAASADSPTVALVLCLLPDGAENSPGPNALPTDSCTAPCGEGPHVPHGTGTPRQCGDGHGEPWGHGDRHWSSWDRRCLSDGCFLQGINEAGNRNVPSTGLDLAQINIVPAAPVPRCSRLELNNCSCQPLGGELTPGPWPALPFPSPRLLLGFQERCSPFLHLFSPRGREMPVLAALPASLR